MERRSDSVAPRVGVVFTSDGVAEPVEPAEVEIVWSTWDGGELWSEDDRFGVRPCPNGWYGYDARTNEGSPVFREKDLAIAWCKERANTPLFSGSTPLVSTRAGRPQPAPPGTSN